MSSLTSVLKSFTKNNTEIAMLFCQQVYYLYTCSIVETTSFFLLYIFFHKIQTKAVKTSHLAYVK